MRRAILLFIALFAISSFAEGQSVHWKYYRHEIIGGLGASNFLGELGGADQIGTNGLKDFEFSMTRPAFNIGYRYKLSPFVAGRITFTYAILGGHDKTTEEISRKNRNLHFKAPIFELCGMIDWFPFREKSGHLYRFKGVRGQSASHWSPYISIGFGVTRFNPKAKYIDGKWHALQPLGTEGQTVSGNKYSRITPIVPLGIGVKYSLDKQWSIGFEISGRMSFTDYIDDVSGTYYDEDEIRAVNGADADMAAYFADPSLGLDNSGWTPQAINADQQRGDPSDNDSYMFAIITINYKLLKGRFNLPKF